MDGEADQHEEVVAPPQIEAEFELPFGYRDPGGRWHRAGRLRMPTQLDLTIVLKQAGEVDNPAYLETLMLARMLVSLGSLHLDDETRQAAIEGLAVPDILELNRIYHGLCQTAAAELAARHNRPLPS